MNWIHFGVGVSHGVIIRARSPISRPLDGAYMYLAKNSIVRSESGTYFTLELKFPKWNLKICGKRFSELQAAPVSASNVPGFNKDPNKKELIKLYNNELNKYKKKILKAY